MADNGMQNFKKFTKLHLQLWRMLQKRGLLWMC